MCIIVLSIFVGFLVFLFFRNNWVCDVRIKWVWEVSSYACHYEIKDTPRYFANSGSYDKMLWMFWRWDIRYFMNDKEMYDEVKKYNIEVSNGTDGRNKRTD